MTFSNAPVVWPMPASKLLVCTLNSLTADDGSWKAISGILPPVENVSGTPSVVYSFGYSGLPSVGNWEGGLLNEGLRWRRVALFTTPGVRHTSSLALPGWARKGSVL